MKRYLGDGVYAEFTANYLTVTVEDGISVLHTVHLDPEVFTALVAFEKEVAAHVRTLQSSTSA